ncbi:MAG: aldo/keto reductase [Pseudomonadota bacterium]
MPQPVLSAGPAAIPALGFGTWPLSPEEAERMVGLALAEGYRHVDTARMYGNEAGVGRALAAAAAPRADVFVTTKIWPDDHAPDRLRAAAEDSLRTLGLDAVDLMLLHWPSRDVPFEATLPALLRLAEDGLARHVGVSNFTRAQMPLAQRLAGGALVCNQVEFHPFLDQSALIAEAAALGLAVTAYRPLGKGDVAGAAAMREIAEAHGSTPAAVSLAWILAKGAGALPKTATPARLAENLSALELTLSAEDVARIDALARLDGRAVNPEGIAPDWD